MRHIFSITTLLLITSLMFTPAAFSADKKKPEMKAPTTEQRLKMADLHTQMAACLKTDKPISECATEMHKSCQDTMGGEACPMMGHMGGHMGHHMKGAAGTSGTTEEEKK